MIPRAGLVLTPKWLLRDRLSAGRWRFWTVRSPSRTPFVTADRVGDLTATHRHSDRHQGTSTYGPAGPLPKGL